MALKRQNCQDGHGRFAKDTSVIASFMAASIIGLVQRKDLHPDETVHSPMLQGSRMPSCLLSVSWLVSYHSGQEGKFREEPTIPPPKQLLVRPCPKFASSVQKGNGCSGPGAGKCKNDGQLSTFEKVSFVPLPASEWPMEPWAACSRRRRVGYDLRGLVLRRRRLSDLPGQSGLFVS